MRWRGQEGSPCLGSVTLGHLTPRLPGRVHPIWPPRVRAGMVLGSRGGGGTWHPQLSVLGTAQRKIVSRWEIPSTAPPGAGANLPLPGPPPSLQAHVDCTWSVRPLLLGAQLRGTSLAVPHFGGEMKVQTVVPLGAGGHQGGGVAPGCKALAEEAWGAHQRPQTPPPRPSMAGRLGDAGLCPSGPLGGPISLALRGA